jgi:RNA polymerase sigma-70 factor (ECF subfamily)
MSTEKLWDTFADRLRAFIFTKVKGEAATDDILQDVFVKVHLKKEQIEDEDKYTAWLFSITRNAISDYYRKQKKTVVADSEPEAKEESAEDLLYNIKCMSNCLYPLIMDWDEKDRKIFIEADFNQTPQIELAERMQIPYSTLKSRLQKLRTIIRDELVQCCNIEINSRKEVVSVDCPKCA